LTGPAAEIAHPPALPARAIALTEQPIASAREPEQLRRFRRHPRPGAPERFRLLFWKIMHLTQT
jgi:hypothetical protein